MTAKLLIPPRQQRHLDKELSRTLTQACETAKAERKGFAWVTHEVQWADAGNWRMRLTRQKSAACSNIHYAL